MSTLPFKSACDDDDVCAGEQVTCTRGRCLCRSNFFNDEGSCRKYKPSEPSHSIVKHWSSILFNGLWSRPVNGCTTCNQSITDETNHTVVISHIIAPRHKVDSEIISNRCSHIWLCNRSLDGDTLQLQNGGHASDVSQSYTSSGMMPVSISPSNNMNYCRA